MITNTANRASFLLMRGYRIAAQGVPVLIKDVDALTQRRTCEPYDEVMTYRFDHKQGGRVLTNVQTIDWS